MRQPGQFGLDQADHGPAERHDREHRKDERTRLNHYRLLQPLRSVFRSVGLSFPPSEPRVHPSPRASPGQTAGAGVNARPGPALHDRDNPTFLADVGWGFDDESVIPDGGSRDIGGGVTVSVSRNRDGSYEVTVAGGRTAAFEPWCLPLWFSEDGEYDAGCFLDTAAWE